MSPITDTTSDLRIIASWEQEKRTIWRSDVSRPWHCYSKDEFFTQNWDFPQVERRTK